MLFRYGETVFYEHRQKINIERDSYLSRPQYITSIENSSTVNVHSHWTMNSEDAQANSSNNQNSSHEGKKKNRKKKKRKTQRLKPNGI